MRGPLACKAGPEGSMCVLFNNHDSYAFIGAIARCHGWQCTCTPVAKAEKKKFVGQDTAEFHKQTTARFVAITGAGECRMELQGRPPHSANQLPDSSRQSRVPPGVSQAHVLTSNSWRQKFEVTKSPCPLTPDSRLLRMHQALHCCQRRLKRQTRSSG